MKMMIFLAKRAVPKTAMTKTITNSNHRCKAL
jgi:hypothetical protein